MLTLNNLIDNNFVIYGLTISIVSLITYLVINSRVIETPNSPQTFNFTHQQLGEIQDFMEEGGVLNQQSQDILDNESETPLNITPEQNNELQDILDNEGDLDNEELEEFLKLYSLMKNMINIKKNYYIQRMIFLKIFKIYLIYLIFLN